MLKYVSRVRGKTVNRIIRPRVEREKNTKLVLKEIEGEGAKRMKTVLKNTEKEFRIPE
jgi:hypothetical protein